MARLKIFMDRLRALWSAEEIHHEINEELQFHVDMRTEENIRRGMAPEDARRDAGRRFGHLAQIKEQGYEVRGGGWLETLWQDTRYGVRVLIKNPSFTAVAVITLALGIGGTTTMFTVLYGVILQPLQFSEPHRLVMVGAPAPPEGDSLAWWDQSQVFENLCNYRSGGVNITTGDLSTRLPSAVVSADFFSVFDVLPQLGRPFVAGDEKSGNNRIAIVSDRLWARDFGATPASSGRALRSTASCIRSSG